MAELILVYHKDDFDTSLEIQRDIFHENRWTLYAEHYLYVIDMFLFNMHGELLMQKRSKRKKTSGWLYHTSVGWHINPGDSPQLTVVKECLEEIGAPCILLDNEPDFERAVEQLWIYTDKLIIAKEHKIRRNTTRAYIDPAGRTIDIQDVCYMGFGIYTWALHNTDRSADWFEYFSLDDLKMALQESPWIFTSSLHVFFENFENDLREFVQKYCSKG